MEDKLQGKPLSLISGLKLHAKGQVKWTASRLPITLIHTESFETRQEAVEREKAPQTGYGRKWLKKNFELMRPVCVHRTGRRGRQVRHHPCLRVARKQERPRRPALPVHAAGLGKVKRRKRQKVSASIV